MNDLKRVNKNTILVKKKTYNKSATGYCAVTLVILCVVCAKGSVHDFTIFKNSKLPINTDIEVCVDLGYQGIKKIVKQVSIPHKKPKGGALSSTHKIENTKISQKRIPIEHINRRCKIFRIVKETFRGKLSNS